MYSKILVPVMLDDEHDPSASLTAAQALSADGATVTVLHVMEAIPTYVAAEIPKGVMERNQESANDKVKAIAARVPGGVGVVISGHAGRTILDYAENNGADCIVVASHKPGIEDYFLGSTASRVVRHAQCSVHVIR